MKIKPYKITFLLFLGGTMGLTSCYFDFEDDDFGCLRGRGSQVSEERFLTDFTSVTNATSANVVIVQGSRYDIEVRAQDNILDEVSTVVRGSELLIDTRRCVNSADIDVFITMPQINALSIIGSGDIFGDNTWAVNDMDLRIIGSGDMDLDVDADDIDIEIRGSGEITLFGTADNCRTDISGSGDLRSFNLVANEHSVTIFGSGDAQVFASDELDVIINGSGDVLYKGSPSISVNISGSGDLVNAN
ncbi:MAG: head GIN domain-containing protein [Cyclobacteriaceae bacterium]